MGLLYQIKQMGIYWLLKLAARIFMRYNVNVKLVEDDTGKVIYSAHNVTTISGRSLIMLALRSRDLIDLRLKYLILGDGTPNFVQSNTRLANEVERISIIVDPLIISPTQMEYVIPIGRPDYDVTETGLAMGEDATGTLYTGTLFNHSSLVHVGDSDGGPLSAIVTISLRDGIV